MNTETTLAVVGLVVVALLIAGWLLFQRGRSKRMHGQIGAEYDRVVRGKTNARNGAHSAPDAPQIQDRTGSSLD